MEDFELLQAYALRRDEAAFATLTARYLNLIYSAAARQTSDRQTAEDLTQAVFLTLARRAGSLSRNTVLPGWLLRTTRFAAANARRLQQRRRDYEQEAMQEFINRAQSDQTWQQIRPLLDEALDQLGEKDRDAVVLRFFQQHSLKVVAQKLGTTEDTAQKRVSRAVAQLRIYFGRHGKTVSAAGLGSALAANSVHAAPPGLAASISAGLAGTNTSSIAATLAEMTAAAIGRARLQILALRWGGLAAAVGLALVFFLPKLDSHPVQQAAEALPSVSFPSPRDQETRSESISLTTSKEGASLLLQVVDARTASPINNVLLTLVSTGVSPGGFTNTFATDAQGRSTILYSMNVSQSWSHRIEVFRDGYVPKFLSWSEYQQDRIEEIPAEYTVRLDPAVTIGGIVVDELETPVMDMRVVFLLTGPVPSRSRERVTMGGSYHTEMTDATGRWSCSHVPSRFGMIAYRLIHPQFQEKLYACNSPDELGYVGIEKISDEDFLAQRAVMRVKSGIIIGGTVTGENTEPIAGAKVSQNYDFRASERNVLTDADGAFGFSNGRPGELPLTVQATGFAPEVISLRLITNVENLQIVLAAGRLLLARVTDEYGQPIRGATIKAASPSEDSRTLFQWDTKTDEDGRFSWDGAPASQYYAIYAPGFQTLSHVTLVADGIEHSVKLEREETPSVRVLGQVLDAETKLPPPSPKIQIWQTTREPGGGLSSFTSTAENLPADGQFRLSTSAGTVSYILEAQGDGYSPERITNEVIGPGEIHVTLELMKAALVEGIVLTPSGEPADGARLAVGGPRQWVYMDDGGKLQIGSNRQTAGTIADAEGHFKLPTKNGAEFVVVAHPSGFAELPHSSVGSNATIMLQPYGRIEGYVRIGGKALSGETVRLENASWPQSRVSVSQTVRTAGDGSFHFDFVPAGERRVEREIIDRWEGNRNFRAYSHILPVSARSGETYQVTLGGSGSAVFGKAIPPDPGAAIPWAANVVTLSLKGAAPHAPQSPVPGDFPSDQAFQAAMQAFTPQNQAFWTSEQGTAAQRLQRHYGAVFDSNGGFRFDDVPPGEYSLNIQLRALARKPGSTVDYNTTPGSLEMKLTIPAAPGESNDAAVNLGDLQLRAPNSGQRASAN
jgi:RNA polymerase sigma factor (sigma-70 family)